MPIAYGSTAAGGGTHTSNMKFPLSFLSQLSSPVCLLTMEDPSPSKTTMCPAVPTPALDLSIGREGSQSPQRRNQWRPIYSSTSSNPGCSLVCYLCGRQHPSSGSATTLLQIQNCFQPPLLCTQFRNSARYCLTSPRDRGHPSLRARSAPKTSRRSHLQRKKYNDLTGLSFL